MDRSGNRPFIFGIQISKAESSVSLSVYAYAANNPVYYNDPLGDQYLSGYTDAHGSHWHYSNILAGVAGNYDDAGIDGVGGGDTFYGIDGSFWGGGGFGSSGSSTTYGSDGSFAYTVWGADARQLFQQLQDAYNNPDMDGNWNFSFGSEDGRAGYWASTLTFDYTNTVGMARPIAGKEFKAFGDGNSEKSEVWYYVLKTKGYTGHAMAYNPQTNMMYEVNKNFGDGNMSKPYKWNMANAKQANAFWTFPGGRGKMLMAPIVVPRSEEATAWFETAVESGQWEYDGVTCNCKTFVTMGLKDAGGAKFSELGPIPGIVGLSFTMYWQEGMAAPAPYTPSHHGW